MLQSCEGAWQTCSPFLPAGQSLHSLRPTVSAYLFAKAPPSLPSEHQVRCSTRRVEGVQGRPFCSLQLLHASPNMCQTKRRKRQAYRALGHLSHTRRVEFPLNSPAGQGSQTLAKHSLSIARGLTERSEFHSDSHKPANQGEADLSRRNGAKSLPVAEERESRSPRPGGTVWACPKKRLRL